MELIETRGGNVIAGGGFGVSSGRGGGLMILEAHFWQWWSCQKEGGSSDMTK